MDSRSPSNLVEVEGRHNGGGDRKISRSGIIIGGILCFLTGTLFQNTQVTAVFNPQQQQQGVGYQPTLKLVDHQKKEDLDQLHGKLRKLQKESQQSIKKHDLALEGHTKAQEQDWNQLLQDLKLHFGNVTLMAKKVSKASEDRFEEIQQTLDSMRRRHADEMDSLKEQMKDFKKQQLLAPSTVTTEGKNAKRPSQHSTSGKQEKVSTPTASTLATTTTTTTTPASKYGTSNSNPATAKYETHSPYAYVIMCWGLNPLKSDHYRGYIANMLLSAKVLRTHGSTADIVAVFRLETKVIHERLPKEDEDLLRAMNIFIRYMPLETPDFNAKQGTKYFFKFYTFGMTEYRRVLFLDGDLLPMDNLDYLFELSDGENAMFKPNIMLAGVMEPCNTGLFVVEPNMQVYKTTQQLIRANWETAGSHKTFDMVNAWGHPFVDGDHWEHNMDIGQKWDFMNSWSDQGLHYHMMMYVVQNVTQILSRKIVNYGRAPNGTTVAEKVFPVTSPEDSPLRNHSSMQHYNGLAPWFCKKWTGFHARDKWPWPGCVPPYNQFDHFSGKRKIWHIGVPNDIWKDMKKQPKTTIYLWYQLLYKLKAEDGLDIQPLLTAINSEGDWDELMVGPPSEQEQRR